MNPIQNILKKQSVLILDGAFATELERRGCNLKDPLWSAKSLMEKSAEIVAYEDLGSEAIRKLYVEDFPVTVVNDSQGNDLYMQGRKEYLEWANK